MTDLHEMAEHLRRAEARDAIERSDRPQYWAPMRAGEGCPQCLGRLVAGHCARCGS